MLCSKCGTSLSDNAKFCSGCGASIQRNAAAAPGSRPAVSGYNRPPVNAPVNPAAHAASPVSRVTPRTRPVSQHSETPGTKVPSSAPAKKKKSAKNIIIPVVALVLVAAIVCGIVFFNKPKFSKENVFSDDLKSVDKKSDAYDAITVLAAAYETLFNAGSLTVNYSDCGDTHFSGTVVFGKDIASSQAYFEFNDSLYFGLNSGKAVLTDKRNETSLIDVSNILSEIPELKSRISEKMDAVSSGMSGADESAQQFYNYINDSINSAEEVITSIVKDKSLNYDSFSKAFNIIFNFTSFFIRLTAKNKATAGTDTIPEDDLFTAYDLSLTTLNDFVSGYLKQLPDGILDISAEKEGDSTTYSVKITREKAKDLIENFLKYAKDSDILRDALNEKSYGKITELIDTLLNKAKDSINNPDDSSYSLTVKVKDNYLTEVKAFESAKDKKETIFTLKIKDINSASVSESKIDKLFDDAENASKITEYNCVDDIFS